MASHYLIVDTTHPLWAIVEPALTATIRWNCVPSYNNAGDKALVQLKDADEIPAWVLNHITEGDGVLWSGPITELYTQTAVDYNAEWADPLLDSPS